jgi:predicted NBD/HSP70 family sugar kinase
MPRQVPTLTTGTADERAGASPRLLRRLSAARVLDALRDGAPMRVSDLVARTQLSRPTVDAVADELIRLGWLAEVGEAPGTRPTRGRPARRLAFRADAGHVVGMDIGEHSVRVVVADLRGDEVARRERALEHPGDGAEKLTLVRRTAASALRAAGLGRQEVLAAAVGCTGGIDASTGRVLFSTAFPGLPDLNLRAALRRTLGRTVLVENDCNLAALGERWRGAAQGVDDVVCVLAGERMGAGIVVSGRLVRGHAGLAGEMPFLGAYASLNGAEGIGYAVRQAGAREVAAQGPTRTGLPPGATLWARTGGDPARVDAGAVFEAARAGDPLAAGVIDAALDGPGRAIAVLALVLNPELVVLGGGVARARDLLLEPLRRRLADMVRLPPRLEASPLCEHGVVMGAVRHALDHVEPRVLDALLAAA